MCSSLKNSFFAGIIFLCLMSLSPSLFSQTPVLYIGTGGTLYIGSGGFVYEGGDVIVDGIGRNEDSLLLTGNLSCDTFTSIGCEIFIGSGNQAILTTIKDLNGLGHFVKQNGGNITLNGDVDCDSLSFQTDGRIIVTDTLKIKDAAATAIKGYGSLRYVDVDDNTGVLSRKTSTINIVYVWPMGNSLAGYKRFDITLSSLGSSGTSFVNGKLKNGSPGSVTYNKFYPTGFSGNYPGMPCTAGTNAQWVSFTCTTPNYYNFTGPSDFVSIVTAWSPSCDPGGAGPQRVAISPAGSGFWDNYIDSIVGTLTTELCENSYWLGGVATSINGGHYLGFGDFAIIGGYGTPLPVELTTFTATAIDEYQYIQLNWTTASELNCDHYILQRSTDARNWQTITTINGNGTTNVTQGYQYNDYDVVAGVKYYYQIIQIDYDGTPHFNNYISCQLKAGSSIIVKNVQPNPGNGDQWLPVYLPKEQPITISCVNVIGQEAWNKKVNGISGDQNIQLDNVSLPKGLYLLQIQIGDKYFIKKFEKQ